MLKTRSQDACEKKGGEVEEFDAKYYSFIKGKISIGLEKKQEYRENAMEHDILYAELYKSLKPEQKREFERLMKVEYIRNQLEVVNSYKMGMIDGIKMNYEMEK